MLTEFKWWARHFFYNYRWSDYVWLIDGSLARLAVVVPILGYLILFNDSIVDHISFDKLAHEKHIEFGLSSLMRLKLVYFGLTLLGMGNLLYRWRRPFVFRYGDGISAVIANALERFTLEDFERLELEISRGGHQTPYGDYDPVEFEAFQKLARGSQNAERGGHWAEAKARYESLLRSMLAEWFFRGDTQRRIELTVCLFLTASGALLIGITSLDLFSKVSFISFKGIFWVD